MTDAPPDTRFRNAVLGITVVERRRPVVVWMGFDDSISAQVFDELFGERSLMIRRALLQTMCFKALLYLSAPKEGVVRATLVLMGSREVYAMNFNPSSGDYAWVEPDKFDVQIMHEYMEWEVNEAADA